MRPTCGLYPHALTPFVTQALNGAIAANNEVEAAHAAAVRALDAQRAAGEAKLKPLERTHARQLRKIERFKTEQAAANDVGQRLRRLSTELSQARNVLECASEALSLQREGATPDLRAEPGWLEAEATLEARRSAAAADVKSLASEKKRAAAEMEKRTRRVVERAGSLGDAAAEALPFLAKQASIDDKLARHEAAVKARGEETAKAKEGVKEAMRELENLSLGIQAEREQQQQEEP